MPMAVTCRERSRSSTNHVVSVQAGVSSVSLASALALQELASQPWAYFTADGNYPPTRAKPEVWSQAGEFKR